MRKWIPAVALAMAIIAPASAQAHSPNQSWFEDHADRAAWDYAHSGDWYEGELDEFVNPTYSGGRRHDHVAIVSLYRMNTRKTQLCWKTARLYWRGFDHKLGRAVYHDCENPRDLAPFGEWRDLDLNDFIWSFLR